VKFPEDDARALVVKKLPTTRNQYTQLRAMEVLAEIGDASSCDVLLNLLDKEGRRGAACWVTKLERACKALVSIGREAVDGLIAQLEHPNPDNRMLAGKALCELTGEIFGDGRPDLWKAWWLEHREEYLANLNLPYPKLTQEQEREANKWITEYDKDKEEAQKPLARLGPGVIPLLRSRRGRNSVPASGFFKICSLMGKPGFVELKRRYARTIGSDTAVRTGRLMAKMDRKAAADFFVEYNEIGKGVYYPLSRKVRFLMEEFCYPEQAPEIRRLLLSEGISTEGRTTLVYVLGKLEGEKAADFLTELLKNAARPTEERLCVLNTLAEISGIVEDAEQAQTIRNGALNAIGADKMKALFKEAFTTFKDTRMTDGWGESFGKTWPHELLPVMTDIREGREPDYTRLRAAMVLCKLKVPGALERVAPFLKSGSDKVRERAIRFTGYEDIAPIYSAVEAMALEDANYNHQIAAIRLLGKSKIKKAIPALMKLLHDPSGRLISTVLRSLDQVTGDEIFGDRKTKIALYDKWWANEQKPEAEKLDEWQFKLRGKKPTPPVDDKLKPELILQYPTDLTIGFILGSCLISFSDDGTKLAYVWVTAPDHVGIKLMDLEAKKPRTLVPVAFPLDIAFSPDGSSVAVASLKSSAKDVVNGKVLKMQLDVVSVDDATAKTLLDSPFSAAKPSAITSCSWVNNENLAAYVVENNALRVELINVRSARRKVLFDSADIKKKWPLAATAPAESWSPFGEKLSIAGNGDIYFCWYGIVFRVNAGSGKAEIVRQESFESTYSNPKVNPKGSRFVLQQHDGETWRFSILDTDMAGTRSIAKIFVAGPRGSENLVNWFPDGKHVVALNAPGRNHALVMRTADARRKIEVPMSRGTFCASVWTLTNNSLAVRGSAKGDISIWRINVAEHLKKLDAMPVPKAVPFKYPDLSSPVGAANTFVEACRRGDLDTLWRCNTAQSSARLEAMLKDAGKQAFIQMLRQGITAMGAFEGKPEVKIEGDEATVSWEDAEGQEGVTWSLQKIGDEWKIGN
ncbi:MAG: hypothetical protein HQ592_11870, partial [Planctomycetes bacterium]|nr:hypothetical protein [Planctomycetota bacterium]